VNPALLALSGLAGYTLMGYIERNTLGIPLLLPTIKLQAGFPLRLIKSRMKDRWW
jgi:hypothetical protein